MYCDVSDLHRRSIIQSRQCQLLYDWFETHGSHVNTAVTALNQVFGEHKFLKVLATSLCTCLWHTFFYGCMEAERGPLSLMSTIEELLGRNNSGSGLENRWFVHGDPSCWPCDTMYRQKLALTSLTSSGCLASIVLSQTEATEFVCLFVSMEAVHKSWSHSRRTSTTASFILISVMCVCERGQ
jgi:hypothetical protein